MFKAILASALLLCASTQDVQGLLNQVAQAAAPYADQVNLNDLQNSLNIVLGEYEWVLTESGEGEVNLEVNSVPGNPNDVTSNIAAALGVAGAQLQDNSNAVDNAANSQGVNVGGAAGAAAQQYGSQLQADSSNLAPVLADAYNQAGAQLAANQNGVADQVNQQLNNAVANGASAQGLQDTANAIASSLPQQTVDNLQNAASQAGDQAASVVAANAGNPQVLAAAQSLAANAGNLQGAAQNAAANVVGPNAAADANAIAQNAAQDAAQNANSAVSAVTSNIPGQ